MTVIQAIHPCGNMRNVKNVYFNDRICERRKYVHKPFEVKGN